MKQLLDGRYAVDQRGNVYSLLHNYGHPRAVPKLLKVRPCPQGYPSVRLWDGQRYHHWRIHRLVAQLYVPNPDNLPQVNHKDGNKGNPDADNLEWCTPGDNLAHAYEAGLKKPVRARLGMRNEPSHGSRPIQQLTTAGVLVQEFPSIAEAARQGFNASNIVSVLKGRGRTCQGFKWRYSQITP